MRDTDRPAAPADGLRAGLKAKSRARRENLKLAAQVEPPSPTPRNDILPALQLVDSSPADLKIPTRNVRTISQIQVREVANSISALGFCVPVLIDQHNGVLDGAVRVEAARLLRLPAVPCIIASHLTTSERKLLRVALNRLQERGTWDLHALRLEINELILEDAPIEIAGFSGAELDQILLGDDRIVEQGPLEPEPSQYAVARRGDVFLLGNHAITCGDATNPEDVARVLEGEKAQLTLTDVPYNVKIAGNVTRRAHREFAMASGEMTDAEFLTFNVAWISICSRYLVSGGILGTFIDWRGYPIVHSAAQQEGLAPLNLIVWAKTNAGMGSLYRSQHELLPLYKSGDDAHVNNVLLGKNGRWRSNLWTYPGASSIGSDARKGIEDHPTVKPVALLEDALLDLTKRGDIIFDPFLGSGSTLIAGEHSGRRCRGIELDPLYIDVIVRRFERETGRIALHRETGESFAAVADRRRHEVDEASGAPGPAPQLG